MELVIKIAAGILLAAAILFVINRAYLNCQALELARAIEVQAENQRAKATAQRQAAMDKMVRAAKFKIVYDDQKRAQDGVVRLTSQSNGEVLKFDNA